MRFKGFEKIKSNFLEVSSFEEFWPIIKNSPTSFCFIAFISPKSLITLQKFPDLFSYRKIWLVNITEREIENIILPFSSQVFTFEKQKTKIYIKEHYNIVQSERIINKIGEWIGPGNFTWNHMDIWERRKDLRGHVFHVETMYEDPYVINSKTKIGKIGKIYGIVGDILHGMLEPSLNFTAKLSLPPDGMWGAIGEDGKWNGLVGGLLENRSQMVATSLYKSDSRSKVILFSKPFTETTIHIWIKYPEREAKLTTFFETFKVEVWFSLLIVLFLLFICLYMTHIFGPENKIDNNNSFNLSNASLGIFGTLIGQGSLIEPKNLSSRIIILVGLFLGIVFVFCFSGSLSSKLAIFHVSYPFVDLVSLLESDYLIGGLAGEKLD